MKKISKNVLIFILGGIVIGSIGVYAATQIASSNVTYTNNNQENVQGAIDDLYSKVAKDDFANNIKCESGKTCIASQLHVGDYVSMTPTLTSYTILASDTGAESNQTINPSELNIWRIININSDGTADAVSEYVSSTNVYFKGKTGYQNYIGTLNKIAGSYTNSSYVIRTRHMGFGAATQYITDTTKLGQKTVPWSSVTSSSITLADEQQGGGDMGYETDYNLVTSVIGTGVANKVGTTTKTAYWLASRRYNYVDSTLWSFRARYVNVDGNMVSYDLYRPSSGSLNSDSSNEAIRPIITLKSGLTTNGGDGKSESTAWTFN